MIMACLLIISTKLMTSYFRHTYLQTPPLGQGMTQGQFLGNQSALLFTHRWRENNWIHIILEVPVV